MSRVWMPLPDTDFDPTETAVPWRALTDAGHEVVFATEHGTTPAADPRLLTGVVFGRLGASRSARRLYRAMADTPAFRSPRAWADIDPADFDGVLLPGGHAPGMRQLLDAALVRDLVLAQWKRNAAVGAICHGVLVLARTRDPDTGASVLADRRTTTLPRYLERTAYLATAWKLGRYYRTYDTWVEDEVRAALRDPRRQLDRGPAIMELPELASRRRAFALRDGHYVSARWPGDAHRFARAFLEALVPARPHRDR